MVYSGHMNRSRHIFFWTAAVVLAVLAGAGLGVRRCVHVMRERAEIRRRGDEACRRYRNFSIPRDIVLKTEAEMDAYVRSMGIDFSRGSNCVNHIGTDKRKWLSRIGFHYQHTYGNQMKATWLLLRAAELGDVPAMCQLGATYRDSTKVPTNGVASITWYRFAHELGNPWGTLGLARNHEKGVGVPVDRTQALALYRQIVSRVESSASFPSATNDAPYQISQKCIKALEAQMP